MKVHITKEKVEKKGIFGGVKASYYVVYAHYELNEEERHRLSKNKHMLSMIAFDFPYRGPTGRLEEGSSPTIDKLTNEKDFRDGKGAILGCLFSNGELQEFENIVNAGAKAVKSELFAGGEGSSVKEI